MLCFQLTQCVAQADLSLILLLTSLQPLTKRELLGFHAEIKALQQRLGISYKDASHRLYMIEMEKVKAEEKIHKITATVKGQTQKALQRFRKHKDADADADAVKS